MDVKLGDILKMNDTSLATGWPGPRWANARFKVVSVLEEHDLDGNPIVRVERLDLSSHARQSWSTKWFEKVEGEQVEEPKVKPGTYPYKPAEEDRICRVCGCTDDHACIVEGDPEKGEDIIATCYWVEPDLCSLCGEKARRISPNEKAENRKLRNQNHGKRI